MKKRENMTKPARLLGWGAIWLFLAPHAPAQAEAQTAVAYRCEVQGEVRYQLHKCEGGQPMVDRDRRTDAQRRDTARATQTDAQLARQLQRERRRLERQAQGQLPTAMDSPKPRHADQDAGQKKPALYPLKRQRHFTAKAPKPDTPKAKANKPD